MHSLIFASTSVGGQCKAWRGSCLRFTHRFYKRRGRIPFNTWHQTNGVALGSGPVKSTNVDLN